jgi:hypothetical protein
VVGDREGRVRQHHRQGDFDQGVVLGEAHQRGIESSGDRADAEPSQRHPDEAHDPLSQEHRSVSVRIDRRENTREEHHCGGVVEQALAFDHDGQPA